MKHYSSIPFVSAKAFVFLFFVVLADHALGFSHHKLLRFRPSEVSVEAEEQARPELALEKSHPSRRDWIERCSYFAAGLATAGSAITANPHSAVAAENENSGATKMFAPGGTLVDYQVGITVGNEGASKSRRSDNSNVVFNQDYYYKFGTAPQFIAAGDTDFPKTMPFVLSQQRYDAMKKYRERVQRGIDIVSDLRKSIHRDEYASIPDGSDPVYSIRPMGLLANSFLASENTGTTNELLLARWYINEICLDVSDIKSARSKDDALKSHEFAVKALNSYLGMLNRSITSKVGDPFKLL